MIAKCVAVSIVAGNWMAYVNGKDTKKVPKWFRPVIHTGFAVFTVLAAVCVP